MITMPSLAREARGAFACSMLDGDALSAVKDLEFPDFAIEGGENVLFSILEARFPGLVCGRLRTHISSRCAQGVGR